MAPKGKNYKLFNFFKKVSAGQVARYEMYEYVQALTNNFELDPLSHIQSDLREFIFAAKKEKRASVSAIQLKEFFALVSSKVKPVYPYFPDDDVEFAWITQNETGQWIDLDKSLFDGEFDPLHELYRIVREKISAARAIASADSNTLYGISQVLETKLSQTGFFELPRIIILNDPSREMLISTLAANTIPYNMAFLHFAGYIKHLSTEHFKVKTQIHKYLADIYSTTPRTIKGNLNVLEPHSGEDRVRYTAYLFMSNVEHDYQLLKSGH